MLIVSTVPLPMDTIFEEAMKSEEGRSLTLERVRGSLVQLGCELPTLGIDETYSVGTELPYLKPLLFVHYSSTPVFGVLK